MKILIIGEEENFLEFKEKFSDNHEYTFLSQLTSPRFLSEKDLVFDFIVDENPDHFECYKNPGNAVIFLNTVKISLAELIFLNGPIAGNIFGFNGLPTFVNREVFEVSMLNNGQDVPDKIFESLNTEYKLVDDRVGMVTPRIIFMIINEAFYVVQEGTASREDIDSGMKLGTNYPFGPFEWLNLIGIHHVYETLEAIYEDTKDERYKICPLLKKEYLLGVS
ncbi:3-hydroxyacyl-CoA dehydrogenase family protein [Fulvivirga ulvae]|uniref:3-hydroxyacyl-CoA dehydrogenase family protein n=1 Tax=Fulvivirga ulvae TaxID=2904245 RepID=UPI001F42D33F|nr:3-hydroxyacyl-CoA dehydrogenase family protein [Fulvivirga ulvae]UII34466.1 3-hydroxyacyl-CoA dehydrogenase family protein [Fulvivirga ulvae]